MTTPNTDARRPTMTQGATPDNSTKRGATFNSAADLLHRIVSVMDTGRKDLLRIQYAEMCGVKHLDNAGQEKELATNKAYQKAREELDQAIQRDRKVLLEVFDCFATVSSIAKLPKKIDPTHLECRRARLERLRLAQRTQTDKAFDEYDKKKKLYDARFETVESDAYMKGLARIEEDKKRYESLSAEFETKLKQEQAAILQAQQALENIEKVRETAEQEAEAARKVEEEIKKRIKAIVASLKTSLSGLDQLADKLVAPAAPKPPQ